MPSKRDLLEKSRQRQAKKADVKPRDRSVICASDGSRTVGSVWADEDAKVVYHQRFGSGGIGRAKCTTIANPELGLGVEVSKIDDRLAEWEVVGDDPFLRRSATDARNYGVTSPQDLLPGGRLMLWVDSRQLTPLATYDTAETLLVNVVSGDYPYNGTRKTFAGSTGQDLTSRVPGAGLTRLVGLYLDSANSLGFVNGATTTIGFTPAEPTWPAGAFRLSVIQLDNGQTSLSFADDIFDRRMIWSDEQGGAAGGWPFTHVLTVSSTNADADYTTLALAIAGASAGDVILLDSETYSLTATVTANKALTIIGSPGGTIITNSITNAPAFDVTADNVSFVMLTLRHTGAGTQSGVIASDNAGLVLDNCLVEKTSGAATTAYALWMFGGSATLKNGTRLTCTSGTDKYGLLQNTAAATITIEGGRIEGTTQDISGNQAGSTLNSNGAILANGLLSFSGTVNGEFLDGAGDVGFGGIPGAGYKVDINGAMGVKQIVHSRYTLADDTATSIAAIPIGNRFIFGIVVNSGAYFWGVCTFNGITAFSSSGFSVVAGGGTLAGTSGPDGTMNARDDNGVLYIENRSGGSATFGVVYICSD